MIVDGCCSRCCLVNWNMFRTMEHAKQCCEGRTFAPVPGMAFQPVSLSLFATRLPQPLGKIGVPLGVSTVSTWTSHCKLK